MSKHTVHFRGSRAEARRIFARVGSAIVGRGVDLLGIVAGVFQAVGFAALSDIKDDFIRKARGGVGEDGVKWAPLSKAYLAYQRRFGKGEKAGLKKAAGLGRAHRHGIGENMGLLTAAQKKRWQAIFASRLARLQLSKPLPEAKAEAAKIAWATLKREGAKTMLEVFGNRQVDILRDTGILFNSLSPGQLGPGGYSPPTAEGGDKQIFQTISNGVIVGTTVPYAAVHQHGSTKQNIPARPFLPVAEAPEAWQQRWADVAAESLAIGIRQALEVRAA